MSFDFATSSVCTHEVIFETSKIDNNKQNIRFNRPPTNRSISLHINGENVPPSGLDSIAQLPFTQSEPYRIIPGVSDFISIQFPGMTPQLIPLITGSNIKASDLVQDLTKKIPNLGIEIVNKRIVLKSRTPVSGTSFTMVDPRWVDKTNSSPMTARILGAYKQLGILPGRVVTGRKIFPRWSLIRDPYSPLDDVMIQLENPIFNSQPLVQLSYITNPANCRRCFGSRIEFDYSITNSDYEQLTDADLLTQEFDKFIFTKRGSHWKWSWLGSDLINRIGGKGSTGSTNVSAMLGLDITTAFKYYQDIKSQQDQRFLFQQVSDAEFPLSLDGISITSPPDDPTVAIVTISVKTRSQKPVFLTRVVGVPNPFSLADQGGSKFLLRG